MASFRIIEITNPYSAEFSAAVKLYNETFPVSEKGKVSKMINWLRKGSTEDSCYHIISAVAQGKRHQTIGFAAFHFLANIDSVFLGYLAVAKGSRRKGVGTKLLKATRIILSTESSRRGMTKPVGIFTELEKEDEGQPETYERFKFWEQQNVIPLKLDWQYPPLYRGNIPAKMYLAFCPISKRRERLSHPLMERICQSIYETVYSRPKDESLLSEVISSFKGDKFVGRVRIRPPEKVGSKW